MNCFFKKLIMHYKFYWFDCVFGFQMSNKYSSHFWLIICSRPRISQSKCFKICIRRLKSLDFHWIYEASSCLLEFYKVQATKRAEEFQSTKKRGNFISLLDLPKFESFIIQYSLFLTNTWYLHEFLWTDHFSTPCVWSICIFPTYLPSLF